MKNIVINMLGYDMYLDISKHAFARKNQRVEEEVKENIIERIRYILQHELVCDYALWSVKLGEPFIICDHTMNFSMVTVVRNEEVEIVTIHNEDAFGTSIRMSDGQKIIDVINLDTVRFSRFDRLSKTKISE